ncbi:glycosyltransferase [Candidatus Liberibacter sp.]|uniref:glycosyltransferase n=1 Tax=Candidatus Liberibacter sp. TaxID=34022 RepID=UPI0015F6BC67|nr:glycosyltransferase [Candidatus Liberibacter sp.]MBA5724271.1 glycosyltransferase [Candidatus Liberibacter sp.]
MFEDKFDIAVLIPCYNEGTTIADVVNGFKLHLPKARIYVYDNNSTDDTASNAMRSGATVVWEKHQGKGNVVRRMFSDVDADLYLMVDGDGTYPPECAPDLLRILVSECVDMVVGVRCYKENYIGRNGHILGNTIFNKFYRVIFGTGFTDIFSGYRAFSQRFVKSFPAVSNGFEVETEMSVYASFLKIPFQEFHLEYRQRPQGSYSKLATISDGIKVLWKFLVFFKEMRPLTFFGMIGGGGGVISIYLIVTFLSAFNQEEFSFHKVQFSIALILMFASFVSFTLGLIFDSIANSKMEKLRMLYMSIDGFSSKNDTRKKL